MASPRFSPQGGKGSLGNGIIAFFAKMREGGLGNAITAFFATRKEGGLGNGITAFFATPGRFHRIICAAFCVYDEEQGL